MKLKTIIFIIIVGLNLPLFSSQEKIIFGKKDLKIKNERRSHPIEDYFKQNTSKALTDSKSANYTKLLVLLVDFVEDNDPNTTGNGKFQTSSDPSYLISIDSPPRNRQFYETHMEALKYYYRAVSFESYQLEYDVYPKNQQAFTLPQTMSYYHPAGASNELFISRVEEYFRDVFETADLDPSIVFSNYGHFMIIHAGSDWQHDTQGDSPSDLPSFFIRVGTGKEVIVDNGQTVISHACNVPETITQDTYERIEGDYTYIYGYGAVNAVYAHEFGHSLGLVDLYNTANSRPQVGVFDIMDSGGQNQITIPDPSQNPDQVDRFFAIEGALPALPGAWSRNLLFKDYFLQKGILKSLSQKYINFDTTLNIKAGEMKYSVNENTPYFYEIPLNEDEYILLENRSIDPDKDGGTSIKSALSGRVALHPCPIDGEEFTYEYDWLLPSWMDYNGNWYGGGILAWHVDNFRLFKTGIYDENNNFISNFDNNSINTYNSKRAVRIIEADNLPDIGNPYSWLWTGTAYEFFFKNKPIIDQNGFFINWSNQAHNDSLSAFTKPALYTNLNQPSPWMIHKISESNPIMSLKVSNALFENTIRLISSDSLLCISPIANFVSDTASDLMISNISESVYFSHTYNSSEDSWNAYWNEEKVYTPSFPIIKADIKQIGTEVQIIIENDHLYISNQDIWFEMIFPEHINNNPLVLFKQEKVYLLIPFSDNFKQYEVSYSNKQVNLLLTNTYPYTGKWASSDQFIFLQGNNALYLFDYDLNLLNSVTMNEEFSNYEPCIFFDQSSQKHSAYVMSNQGNIYRIDFTSAQMKANLIFNSKSYGDDYPSQIALGFNNNLLSIHFAKGNRAFQLMHDGSLYQNFPKKLDNFSAKAYSFVNVLMINHELISVFEDQENGFFGINERAEIDYNYTAFWKQGVLSPIWFKENESSRLYLLYSDSDHNIYISWKNISETDGIVWNAYRNNHRNNFLKGEIITQAVTAKLSAYAFPNPSINSMPRLRISNAFSDIKVVIYDISGNIILQKTIEKTEHNYQDFQFDTTKISSGVYIAIISDQKNTQRVKFSVIK